MDLKEIVKKFKSTISANNNKDMAQCLKITVNTINGWLQSDNIPYDKCHETASAYQLCLNWFIFGYGKKNIVDSHIILNDDDLKEIIIQTIKNNDDHDPVIFADNVIKNYDTYKDTKLTVEIKNLQDLSYYYIKKNKYVYLDNIIKRMKNILNVTSNRALAQYFNINESVVRQWSTLYTMPYKYCHKIAFDKNISFDWLVTGRGKKEINYTDQQHDRTLRQACFSLKSSISTNNIDIFADCAIRYYNMIKAIHYQDDLDFIAYKFKKQTDKANK